jgi:hypothetical protein
MRERSGDASPATGHPFLPGEWWQRVYGTFDRRTLGFTRLLLGFLLLTDLFRRLPRWFNFYTDQGLFPRFADFGQGVPWSLFNLLSTRTELAIAFAVLLVVYTAVFVGFHTRVAHPLAFLLLTSLDARALIIENGGNWAFNLLVFWTMFLPMGDRFSVDALRASLRARRETTEADFADRRPLLSAVARAPHVSLVGPAVMLQLCVIYLFNALAKTGGYWRDLTAIRPVLYADRIATPLAAAVRDHLPLWLIKVMTASVLATERVIAVFVVSPVYRVGCKRACIVLINGLHIGLGLMLTLGDFTWSCCVFSTLLFSREDWEIAERTMRRPHRARTVLFDPASPRSLRFCRLVVRLDRFELLTFRAASDLGARFAVLGPNGERTTGGDALAEIIAALPLGPVIAWLARVPPFAWLAGAAEAGPRVADAPAAPSPARVAASGTPRSRRAFAIAREAVVLVVLVSAIIEFSNDTPLVKKVIALPRPAFVRLGAYNLRMMEGWSMFAPEPLLTDGALVVDAVTIDGRHVDPFTGRPPNFDLAHAKSLRYGQFYCDYAKRVPDNPPLERALKAWVLRYPERTGRAEDAVVGGAVHWVHDKNPVEDEPESHGLEDKTLFSLDPNVPEPAGPAPRGPRP